jgi:hypothetical protein
MDCALTAFEIVNVAYNSERAQVNSLRPLVSELSSGEAQFLP